MKRTNALSSCSSSSRRLSLAAVTLWPKAVVQPVCTTGDLSCPPCRCHHQAVALWRTPTICGAHCKYFCSTCKSQGALACLPEETQLTGPSSQACSLAEKGKVLLMNLCAKSSRDSTQVCTTSRGYFAGSRAYWIICCRPVNLILGADPVLMKAALMSPVECSQLEYW